MKKILLLIISLLSFSAIFAQQFRLSGKSTDAEGHLLSGVNIRLEGQQVSVISAADGSFDLGILQNGNYTLQASREGYFPIKRVITINQNNEVINLTLKVITKQLADVEIIENLATKREREESMNVQTIKRDFLIKNLGGSLMKSLERLPGIKNIGIGSGQSKPLIRGMGFNRVVVVDKGVKHEGQQWGADHGLEIDQFAAREVEVIKGAASFVYGSDAIGGVVDVKPELVPLPYSFSGAVNLIGKTNNALYGTSVNLKGRNKNWFFDSRVTYQNYGDYKVPTDSVFIYDYAVALNNGYLRNTAGKETNLHLSTGYIGESFRSIFYISNVYSKSGFFANAHGLEPRKVDETLHDASSRDILMPNQEVNHFKIINRTDIQFDKHLLKLDFGYQHNFRQEFSQYVNHGYMPPVYPADRTVPSDLEREFDKQVYSFNVKDFLLIDQHELTFGINSEYQNNKISGWSFLVPAFQQFSTGAFIYDKYKLSSEVYIHGAIRYDYARLEMEQYRDWFLYPLSSMGSPSSAYLNRSIDLSRNFNSLVYSLGMNFNRGGFGLKWNLGKSFRIPIAKELGANGVNYHYFSYEKGNPNLNPEVSYQADLGLGWKSEKWSVDFTPFYNFFPNYIYLNPTAEHDYAYGAGNQIFEYSQSKVMRYGAEISLKANLLKKLSAEALAEYLYAEQLSGAKKGYVLPFSPPPSVLFNLTYSSDLNRNIKNAYLSVDYRLTAKQDNIVPPERKTAGYKIVNLQVGATINFAKIPMAFNLQAQNLFNTKYLNHTSFYRLIELPEAGRNLIFSLSIPFTTQNLTHK